MGKINRDWHLAHRMPPNPTEAQRLAWHIEHAAHCACRAIPPGAVARAARQGVSLPAGPKDAKPDRD